MKFFLIANNVHLTNEIIDNLDIKYDDYIILFNHQFPIKYSRISNHKNKIIFIRIKRNNSKEFNGIEQLKQNYKEFEEIYIVDNIYENYSSSISIIKNKLNDDNVNLCQLPSEVFAYIKTLDIPSGKSCTTGLYAYIYFNYYYNRKNIDKIVLVGFDLNYPHGISKSHSTTFELNYYNNEFTKNDKLIKIESSNKSLNDSEISENYHYNKDNINVNKLKKKWRNEDFRLENVANKNVVNKNVANKNVANKNVANKNVANKNVANKNVANKNVANKNVANKNVANKNVVNKNIVKVFLDFFFKRKSEN
jgi:hypothetical protein